MVREVDITTQRAIRPLRIGIIADPHFNSYDSEDISSSNPTLLNTIKTRKWLENGQSVPQTDACLDFISDCDQLIVLGDILDYLSHGAMELAKKHIFEKYPNIIACVGNHDATQRIGGSIKETSPLEERIRLLQSIWPHDIAYHSRMLGDSVMLIQMDNGTTGFFTQSQVDSLKKDIDTARENGYTVLIFLHKPLSINNPTVTSTFPIRRNQGGLANFNTPGLIGYHSLGASAEGYNIIANSADIIKGIFGADLHSDYYMKICAKTPDGGDAFIRQYVLTGTPFDQGHVMIVNIK